MRDLKQIEEIQRHSEKYVKILLMVRIKLFNKILLLDLLTGQKVHQVKIEKFLPIDLQSK